ncbi:hypothetical protein P168DRAFT_296345 [Aspergillus campestris IBT 28561]|uniref:Altered inheritance of mitochondria protein 9, mitochondrial n=1 Tax=Aspergillus campestris (strain IBT 28561) TaxID=1392248 RepID=A0A2I1D871_ASPC2|nr:uncharacterized protein P168DRAFT_296345 [Aspergillus campestris IBT 28561]PKY06081.1 hypothetical protein P168DRAFT_296345 [Aspergillus campestris IBT 28561]
MSRIVRHPLLCTLRGQPNRASSQPFVSTSAPLSSLQPLVIRAISTTNPTYTGTGTKIDPHAYTSGRWLRRDRQEIASRYIPFDFDALCQKVVGLCPGAGAISACRKLEGGFNRVFIFTLDNGKKIVARLPFRLAGPARLTTLSEVATIRYLQEKTRIPIPEILDWSHDSNDINNTVGSEYIIMEHANGVPLHDKWPTMAGDQQVRCINAIYQTMKEMVDLEFPAFGSIYFDDALDYAVKQSLGDGICIGPHCGTRYRDCDPAVGRYYHYAKKNPGPWQSIGEYCDGLIDSGLSRIPAVDLEAEKRPIYHGSPQTHLDLLEHARPVLKRMPLDPRIRDSAAPLLFHPDLHKRNIFVSEDNPSTITSIIDWQATSIEPAFGYADHIPDFATGSELCTKTFELSSQFLTPRLSNPRLIDDNLFRPFRYSHRTWKDGAVALRHEMIETARLWTELGFEGQCPYPLPTRVELADHEKEYKLFEAAQQLRLDLSNLLDTASDGWIPADRWEETQLSHKELFNGMLQAVLSNPNVDEDEPVKDEKTLRSIWPFDLDQ